MNICRQPNKIRTLLVQASSSFKPKPSTKMKKNIILCVGTFFYSACAFCPTFGTQRRSLELFAGAAPAKPKVEIGQKTAVTQKVGQKSSVKQTHKAKVSEPVKRREKNTEDAPLYKVMLIGDEEYDQEHTIERICDVMEDVDEGQAASVFTQAQAGGKAMINKYPFEHAELYVEQLLRSDPMIFCDLEEEERMGSGK